MRSRSAGPVLALLAVTLAPRLSYTAGTPRMPGEPRRRRQSAACTTRNCRGRLRKLANGQYHCSSCDLLVDRLPPRPPRKNR